jgi:phosphotransferase system HPr (HPr) family protein
MVKQIRKEYKNVTIKNELGLHARSAAQIAKIAQNAASNVWIVKDDEKADASSIIDVLTLVCEKGTNIRIVIDDAADKDILNAIADLVDNGFGE